MNPEYGEFDGTPMDRKMPWGDTHGRFYSDAYRTAANIGLDCAWFDKDEGHYGAPLRLMFIPVTGWQALARYLLLAHAACLQNSLSS